MWICSKSSGESQATHQNDIQSKKPNAGCSLTRSDSLNTGAAAADSVNSGSVNSGSVNSGSAYCDSAHSESSNSYCVSDRNTAESFSSQQRLKPSLSRVSDGLERSDAKKDGSEKMSHPQDHQTLVSIDSDPCSNACCKIPTPTHIGKDRLCALTDAVLAIIMTLLVLNLPVPKTLDLAGFLSERESYFAYTFSFSWLGFLWVTYNSVFALTKRISKATVGFGMILLFICSLVPYVSNIASDHFSDQMAQTLVGILLLFANVTIMALFGSLKRANPHDPMLTNCIRIQLKALHISIFLKLLGLILCWLWWPPAVMVCIVIGTILSIVQTNRSPAA